MNDKTKIAAHAELLDRISACLVEADGLELHLVAAHLDGALNALETNEPHSSGLRPESNRPLH